MGKQRISGKNFGDQNLFRKEREDREREEAREKRQDERIKNQTDEIVKQISSLSDNIASLLDLAKAENSQDSTAKEVSKSSSLLKQLSNIGNSILKRAKVSTDSKTPKTEQASNDNIKEVVNNQVPSKKELPALTKVKQFRELVHAIVLMADDINNLNFEEANKRKFVLFGKTKFEIFISSFIKNLTLLLDSIKKFNDDYEDNQKLVKQFSNTTKLVSRVVSDIADVSKKVALMPIYLVMFGVGSVAFAAMVGLMGLLSAGIGFVGKVLGPKIKKNVKNFQEIAKDLEEISESFAIIGATCVALSLEAKITGKYLSDPDVYQGLVQIGAIVAASGLILITLMGFKKLLLGSSGEDVEDIAEALPILIGGVSLACLLMGYTAKKIAQDSDQIREGLVIIGEITGASFVILGLLAAIDSKTDNMMKVAVALPVFMSLLSLASFIIIKLAIYAASKEKELRSGLVTVGVIVASATALFWLVSKIGSNITSIAGAILGVGAMTVVIGLVGALIYGITKTAMYVQENHDVIWDGLGQMAAILALSITTVVGIGALIAAAAAPLAAIGAAVLLASGAVVGVTELIKCITDNTIKNSKLIESVGGKERFKELSDDQIDILKHFLTNLTSIGSASMIVKFAKQQKNIRKLKLGVLDISVAIGEILSMIERLGSMKIVDHFTPDGKPVYRKLDITKDNIVSMASTLSEVITAFFDNLIGDKSVLLSNIDPLKKNAGIITNALLGGRTWIAGLFGTKSRTGGILDVISQILDIIQEMGSMKIITGYDDNGKPIYATIRDKEAITEGGATLAGCITGFLNELVTGLNKGLNEELLDNFADAAIVLMGGSKASITGGLLGLIVGGSAGFKNIKNGGMLGVVRTILDIIKDSSTLTADTDFKALGSQTGGAITGFMNALTDDLVDSFDKDTQKKFNAVLKALAGKGGALDNASKIFKLIQDANNLKVDKLASQSTLLGDGISDLQKASITAGQSVRSFIRELYRPITYGKGKDQIKLQPALVKSMTTAYKVAADDIGKSIKKIDSVMNNSIKNVQIEKLTKKFNDLTDAVHKFNNELNKTNAKFLNAVQSSLSNDGYDTVTNQQTQSDSGSGSNTGSSNQEGQKVIKAQRYVALDTQTLNVLRLMFEELSKNVGQMLSNEESKSLFVNLDGNILSGEVKY